MDRCFAGDLDAVEMRALTSAVEASPTRRERYDNAYDAATATKGWMTFVPGDPELAECFSPDTLERYGREELDSADAALVEAHLGCRLCRAQVEVTTVAASTQRASVGAGPSRRWSAALALAAGLVLAFALLSPTGADPDFVPRGVAPSDASWVRIFVARGERLEPVEGVIRPSAELGFAYTNGATSPYHYLAIAGRDAGGRVHWYHPAYVLGGEQPRSIDAPPGSADAELSTAVGPSEPYPDGRLEICAMFSVEPIDVREADRDLEAGGSWPGDRRDCHVLEVRR
ncbi:MAG: hypothetical protein RIT81_41550 [Deltaproteobacteria bacterium]